MKKKKKLFSSNDEVEFVKNDRKSDVSTKEKIRQLRNSDAAVEYSHFN